MDAYAWAQAGQGRPVKMTETCRIFTKFQRSWDDVIPIGQCGRPVTKCTPQPLKTFRRLWLALITIAQNSENHTDTYRKQLHVEAPIFEHMFMLTRHVRRQCSSQSSMSFTFIFKVKYLSRVYCPITLCNKDWLSRFDTDDLETNLPSQLTILVDRWACSSCSLSNDTALSRDAAHFLPVLERLAALSLTTACQGHSRRVRLEEPFNRRM